MVSLWAERNGYTFEPESYYWRHYYGYEVRTLGFTATPGMCNYVPIIAKTE